MYYPSFFAGVRPFETLRERVDNPLDLSVKQTVSRTDGSCPPEHEDLQLLMERKLAVAAGLPSQPMAQQMPLLDNMFATYKPFAAESISCQMRRPTDLLPPNMNPSYCTTSSSGHPINHLGLVPDLLHQNRDALTMEAAAPPLSSFAMSASGLPYHMRIGSAVMANQRTYFGHNSVLGPHMSAPFGASISHIPLYTDLMSGLTRRPIESETGVFGTLSSMRGPPDPSTQFSEHLQRLREHHIHQNKCTAPCCMPSTLHTSGVSHSHNGCSCCDVGLTIPSNVSSLVLPPTHATAAASVPVSMSLSCNEVCNRNIVSNNSNTNSSISHSGVSHSVVSHSLSDKSISNKNNENNSFSDNSLLFKSNSFKQKDFELKTKTCADRQSTQQIDNEFGSGVGQNNLLSNPSNSSKNVFQPIECFSNKSSKCDPILNSNDRQKELFCLNSNVSNKFKKESTLSQNNTQEVITLDETTSENETDNSGNKDITQNSRHKYEDQNKCELSDSQTKAIIYSTGRSQRSENSNDSFNRNDLNKQRSELFDQKSGQILNQINVLSEQKVDKNSDNVYKIGISNKTDDSNDNRNTNSSKTKLNQEFNENSLNNSTNHQLKGSANHLNSSELQSGLATIHPKLNENQINGNVRNIIPKVSANVSSENVVSVKSVTKQLKDYKPVPKHININPIDKNKRLTKETKTVEVQCDGPDWTPIVLPQQLKNKLHKAVKNKLLFGTDLSKMAANQLIYQKKDSKKKKKCKQKHSHWKPNKARSRSRSSSVSSTSSRKSYSDRHSNHSESNNSLKSRKRSMLQCLVNSEGYVADKLKKTDLQPNLIASDPSQLGREERALQRAIKHIEDLNKPYTRDNSVKNNAKNSEITENNNQFIEIKSIAINKSTDSQQENEESMKKISETYQQIIESVIHESRLQNNCSDESNKKQKKIKKSTHFENLDRSESNTSRKEPALKLEFKKKRKLSQQAIGKLIDENQPEIDKSVGFKAKKKRLEQKCDNKVTKIETNGNCSENITAIKQKKSIVSVRRRRFRSGLDMIRNAHRRKKSKNHIQSSVGKQEANRSGAAETNKDLLQKSSCDPANGSVPTEMKRLMVNKALGETLLHRAARSNRLDVVNFCLQSNTCDVNVRDNANYTPLHECSTRGNLQIARLLLQNGADVNASATGGIRPIHDAIENNHIEVVRLLLSYGADPNISTYSGSTALELSRSKLMLTFLRGFFSDISSDSQRESKEDVLSWKFDVSSNILDTNQTGFDVLDGLSTDEVEDESHDFLFEVCDSPMDPTYLLPNLRTEGSDHFMRLSDVLNRTHMTKDQFLKKHSQIEILTINRNELEEATAGQIPNKLKTVFPKNESSTEDIVLFDDRIRTILGIETLRLR